MLSARLITGASLLAGFVAALVLVPNPWWTVLLLPPLAIASWEWGALAGWGRAACGAYSGVVAGSAWWIGILSAGMADESARVAALEPAIYGAGVAFWLLIALPWLAWRRPTRSAAVLALAGWMVLVPAWLALARLQSEPGRLLTILCVVWLADTAAYLAGSAWGKHRLLPQVSPGKTWEGLAGAVAAVGVYYAVLSSFAPEWRWWQGWAGGALFAGIALMSVVGDLFESWIKRQAGVKDSGTLLPGHGGVLDRIDSMTSSLPLAALLLPHIR